MKKNVFILVLCALMAFSSIPKTVMADESSGIEIETTKENEVITEEYGNVDTTDSDDTAVYLDASYDNSSIDVKVGDVNSGGYGVDVYAYNGGSVKADIGNVTAVGDGVDFDADYAKESNIEINVKNISAGEDGVYGYAGDGASVKVTTGNIDAENKGIRIRSYSEGETELTVNGDVNAKDNYAIHSTTRDEGTAILEVDGNVSSEKESTVNVRTYNDGSFIGNITGDVTSSQKGIYVEASSGGEASLAVGGDVKGDNTGIVVTNYESDAEYTMAGTNVGILVEGDISGTNGAYLYGDSDANVFLSAEGSIKGQYALDIAGDNEASFTVDAKSIEGSDAAVCLSLYDDSNAVIVADTIKGGEVAIVLDDSQDQSTKNIKIVAWKIELNKDGNVAENIDYYNDTTIPPTKNEAFEKNNILYVLKLEQPEEGGDIALDMEREIDTFYDDEAWAAVKEETKVYVNVNVKDGYKITGVYNGKGEKTDLEKDDKGYYIVVPKGGGVYLTALLEANYNPQPAPSSDYDYNIIDQTKGSQVIRGGESYFVRINAPINDYDSTWVDNKNVSKYATVTEGSTIVTLDPGFLSTLSVGWHNLMVKFKSGREVFSRFVITKSYKVPTTGVDRISHQYKGYSVALFAIVSSIAIIKSKKAYKVK